MTKTHFYIMALGLAGLVGSQATNALAQTVDNNFARDRNVAVNERAKVEYTPLGIHMGAFMIQPQVGIDLGYNDNIRYDQTNKKSSGFLQATPSFEAMSGWSRNMLNFGFTSNLATYGSASSENVSNWNLHANGRYDISSRLNIFGSVAHDRSSESRANPFSAQNSVKPIQIDMNAGTIGFRVVGNRLRFIGTAGSAEQTYKNGVDSLGAVVDERFRNMTMTTFSGRADYALSPDLSLFVYAESNKRDYKTFTIFNSSGSTLSVGTSFDLDKLARGEIQVGTFSQDYKQQAAKQNNTYFNGKVEYFPTQLTTVTGTVGRTIVDSQAVGALSALTTSESLSVDHELLRNLILSASLSGVKYEYTGLKRTDNSTDFRLGGRYFLSPRISVNVNYTYLKLASTGAQAFRSYKDNMLQAGIVLKY